ncbi:MAG TPA: type VII secretion-associated protein [Pseudonocardia sp.]|nr:type VII secretion-associated protein [Pseudonocardia sp.]
MSAPPRRVAVHLGRRTLRVAGAGDDGEPPHLIAVLPRPVAGLAQLLAELVGPAPDELVLVHPANWPPSQLVDAAAELNGAVAVVRTVSTPAAAAELRPCVVLDVGSRGAEITALAADGGVLRSRASPVGGDHLDEVLARRLRLAIPDGPAAPGTELRAEARRLRERLSLLPAAEPRLGGSGPPTRIAAAAVHQELTEQLAELIAPLRELAGTVGAAAARGTAGTPATAVPVLLIGGVARDPLLAELVDAAGFTDVRVPAVPDAAAVLGALRPRSDPPCGRAPPGSRGPSPRSGAASTGDATARTAASTGAAPTGGAPGNSGPMSVTTASDGVSAFPSPPRRPLRTAALALAATGTAVLLLLFGGVLAARSAPAAEPVGVLVQYGYRFDVPTGWEHTGGLPERRRVLLTPAATPEGSDLIAVELSPLGYDAAAEPQRARAELRAEFQAAVATGSDLTDFRAGSDAGREVVRYQQLDRGTRTEVDWFVIMDDTAQLSVGCRHTAATAAAVRAACATVVASVRIG